MASITYTVFKRLDAAVSARTLFLQDFVRHISEDLCVLCGDRLFQFGQGMRAQLIGPVPLSDSVHLGPLMVKILP